MGRVYRGPEDGGAALAALELSGKTVLKRLSPFPFVGQIICLAGKRREAVGTSED